MLNNKEDDIFARALARKEAFASSACGLDHDIDYVMMALEETGGSVRISEFKRLFGKSELKASRQIAKAVKEGIIISNGQSIRISPELLTKL